MGSPNNIPLDQYAKLAETLNSHDIYSPISITDAAVRHLTPAHTSRPANNGYCESVDCGSSVGVLGSPNAGTLGGYIRLKGHKDIFAMSCHHVVSAKTPAVFASSALTVQQPADLDVEESERNLNLALAYRLNNLGDRIYGKMYMSTASYLRAAAEPLPSPFGARGCK